MHLKILIFIFTSLLLLGCSNTVEDDFVGKWERAENKKGYTGTIQIVKNGDTLFLVADEKKYSGNIGDDGTLHISGPIGVVSYSYINETDTITAIGKEYKRVK